MKLQNRLRWLWILLILMLVAGNQVASAASNLESTNQLHGNHEQSNSDDPHQGPRDAGGDNSHHPDTNSEPDLSAQNHEFHAQSDENGVRLMPVAKPAAQNPVAQTMKPPPKNTPVPTQPPRQDAKPDNASTPAPASVLLQSEPTPVSLLAMLSALRLNPIAQNGSISASSQTTLFTDQHTVLTTTPQLAIQPGSEIDIVARLLINDTQPLSNEEVVLLTDDTSVQQGKTDTTGSIHFQLPESLTAGDHQLKFIYAGRNGLLPSVVESTLHYHTETPGSAASQSVDRSASVVFADRTTVAALKAQAGMLQSSVVPANATVWQSFRAMIAPMLTQAKVLLTLVPGRALNTTVALWALFGLVGLGVVTASVGRLGGYWGKQEEAQQPKRVAPVSFSFAKFSKLNALFLPTPVWYGMRVTSIGCALGLAIVLFVRPERGLFIFWQLFIPCVPMLFFVAPGLWRNICPMAALNQTPRLFHFTKGWTTPKWMQQYGYLISISLFLVLVSSRKVLFNYNGPALAILILVSLASAFVMGNFFKGKSGWCSSICPLLPVQRIYGQTPLVTVNHAHCEPCLGCTKNCYDLSPKNAYLADLYDDDKQFAGFRKAFAGLFPGFVLAFYLLPNPPAISIWQMVAGFVFAAGLSMASFFLLDRVLPISSNKITVIYGALALNAYYWFNSVSLGSLFNANPPLWFVWPLRIVVFGLTLFWIYRTWQKEQPFIELTLAPQTFHSEFRVMPKEPAQGVGTKAQPGKVTFTSKSASDKPVVRIEPEGKCITVENNRTLLEIIESNGLPIETGCRMGLCGADPICVHEGMENLSKAGSDERNTLERLALAPNTRMACMARVRGDVKIGLTPGRPEVYQSSIVAGFKYDKSIQKVVIIGNGIAGVTAADHIRRRHPHCEIHLIGRERHHLYNRMGIARLIYGRSAMQGLYLLPDQWYEDFNITCWLNTHVTGICRDTQKVKLGTGDELSYDRLILTTGSQSFVPPIVGFGMAGSFVLRSAEDAMTIRAYVQEQGARQAIVAGGGLLGLEAAYALHKLGMRVTVLERSKALLSRQLDARSGEFLRAYLEGTGIQIAMECEAELLLDGADGRPKVKQVQLKNGRRLPCDLILVAAGIAPDIELAKASGLKINRAVIVDSQMRTSDPCIFAAGDVAEYDEKVYGLWPVAVSQAEIAAASAVAGAGVSINDYIESAPVTMLKVAGIDVTSIGRIKTQVGSENEEEIVLEESGTHRYRKLVIANGMIVGAILLDAQQDAPGVTEAIKTQMDVRSHLESLRSGNWQVLHDLA